MARHIHITGIVQGVGFRPFVYRLAHELGLNGWVRNATDGVHIHVEGSDTLLERFVEELGTRHPAAALITDMSWQDTSELCEQGFYIRASEPAEGMRTLISPDLASCPDCLAELLDPHDRRYHYPFINCTNCGPRFTIIEDLPYDRAQTAMAAFAMCEPCEHEYHDPANRRFHAQPDACFTCGPRLQLFICGQGSGGQEGVGERPKSEKQQGGADAAERRHSGGEGLWFDSRGVEQSDDLICRTVALLRDGRIVAVKGLGGYHLVCDATNEAAVMRLRERKQRPRKPLAVMFASLAHIQQRFAVSSIEAALLTSPAAPIVLVRGSGAGDTQAARLSQKPLAPALACGVVETGVMLPATPLQHLLLGEAALPLVMTSGNVSDEPIIGNDALAQELLGGIADAFLLHDRPIVSRYDDSVLRVLTGSEAGDVCATQFVRRARGYAPLPRALPVAAPLGQTVLAVGPEHKNTFCMTSGADAFVSQHLGNLSNANSFDNQLKTISLYERLFSLAPTVLACDLHPDYLSTRWAHEQARLHELPLIEVQHHHAHIAAVLAEHLTEDLAGHLSGHLAEDEQEVIGIALDGTGYGPDGTVWGGEVLIASLGSFYRFAHLERFRLPGGAQAIYHPLRLAYALLLHYGLAGHPAAAAVIERLGQQEGRLIEQMVERGLGSPETSSAGRLFDAVSALLGICDKASYEGEPAVLLEAAAYGSENEAALSGGRAPAPAPRLGREAAYSSKKAACSGGKAPYSSREAAAPHSEKEAPPYCLSTRWLIGAVLDRMHAGLLLGSISRGFHEDFMALLVNAALLAREKTGLTTVALSGGVFNNRLISSKLPRLLEQAGFTVLTHRSLPPNDGCISYGQAAVACARLSKGLRGNKLYNPCGQTATARR
jgi:hydrogenase maturation protein HypF